MLLRLPFTVTLTKSKVATLTTLQLASKLLISFYRSLWYFNALANTENIKGLQLEEDVGLEDLLYRPR